MDNIFIIQEAVATSHDPHRGGGVLRFAPCGGGRPIAATTWCSATPIGIPKECMYHTGHAHQNTEIQSGFSYNSNFIYGFKIGVVVAFMVMVIISILIMLEGLDNLMVRETIGPEQSRLNPKPSMKLCSREKVGIQPKSIDSVKYIYLMSPPDHVKDNAAECKKQSVSECKKQSVSDDSSIKTPCDANVQDMQDSLKKIISILHSSESEISQE